MDCCFYCSRGFAKRPTRPIFLFHTAAEGRYFRLWRRPYREFKHSASSCKLCYEIYDHHLDPGCREDLKEFFQLPDEARDETYVQSLLFWTGTSFDSVVITFLETDYSDGSDDGVIDDRYLDDNDIWLGSVAYALVDVNSVVPHPVKLGPASDAFHIQLMPYWMSECQKHHKRCFTPNEDGWLPTRLLDVSRDEMRLIRSDEVARGSHYVTLSHRWNDAIEQVKLMVDEIPLVFDNRNLPQTFRDSADYARLLGIRYLWIDCLCIQQNDEYDWRIESALMGKVYQHAVCNFAATAASGGRRGLQLDAQRCEESGVLRCRIKCSWNTRNIFDSREYYLVRSGSWPWEVEVDRSEINGRGWVFQERLLSPRTIHFGKDRLFWECRESLSFTAISNDDSVLEVKTPKGHGRWKNPKEWAEVVKEARARFILGHGSLNELYQQWEALRCAYVKTSVTHPKDRLVALSGLVGVFENLLGEGEMYLAGHWRRTLTYDLLWSLGNPGQRSGEGAPSWSWASIRDGDIRWMATLPRYPHDSQELANIIRAETIPHTEENRMGQVLSGRIEVQGFLFPFDSSIGLSIRFSEELLQKFGYLEPPKEVILEDALVRFDEASNMGSGSLCSLFPLLLTNLMLPEGCFRLSGLVLRPDDKHTRRFERIGYFECRLPRVHEYYWFLDYAVSATEGGHESFYQTFTIV